MNGSTAITVGGIQTTDLPSCGLGTMRTSGTYIGALLQLEHSHWYRVGILAEVMKAIGVTPEEIADEFSHVACSHCGMGSSAMRPCECHEARP